MNRHPFLLRVTALVATAMALCLLASPAAAQTGGAVNTELPADGSIRIETPIPQSALEKNVGDAASKSVKNFAEYLGRIYNFAIAIVGLVAAVMMIIGGFQYLTSAGDAGKIGAAKKRITDAIIGLVLTLGSYALLRSLNPQLVNFHPLTGVEGNKVKTKVITLPWCEDLIKKGIKVTKVSDDTACGSVGSYKAGTTESACLYYGECGANRWDTSFNGRTAVVVDTSSDQSVWRTCMPYVSQVIDGKQVDFTSDLVLAAAKSDTHSGYAVCMPCAVGDDIYVTKLGYPDVATGCGLWDTNIKARMLDSEGEAGQYWSSCVVSSKNSNGCEQTDIDCQAVDNNSDGGSSSQCSGSDNDCGCEGYDDEPASYVYNDEKKAELVKNLDDLKDHLSVVCGANPCKKYVNTINGGTHFLNGCQMTSSTDCRNISTAKPK
jgi:hypothetical protein